MVDIKTDSGTQKLKFHTEGDPSGKITKYRKWVGKVGVNPHVIGWWDKGKFNFSSKQKKIKYNKVMNIDKNADYVILDNYGFSLYADVAYRWKEKNPSELTAILVPTGEVAKVTLAPAGTAQLRPPKGEEITAQRVRLSAPGFNLDILVGDKPVFLGVYTQKLLALPKGWTLVGVKDLVPGEQVTPEETDEPDAKEDDNEGQTDDEEVDDEVDDNPNESPDGENVTKPQPKKEGRKDKPSTKPDTDEKPLKVKPPAEPEKLPPLPD